jgi:hypothetical protein
MKNTASSTSQWKDFIPLADASRGARGSEQAPALGPSWSERSAAARLGFVAIAAAFVCALALWSLL